MLREHGETGRRAGVLPLIEEVPVLYRLLSRVGINAGPRLVLATAVDQSGLDHPWADIGPGFVTLSERGQVVRRVSHIPDRRDSRRQVEKAVIIVQMLVHVP